jgi:hypothetical protein
MKASVSTTAATSAWAPENDDSDYEYENDDSACEYHDFSDGDDDSRKRKATPTSESNDVTKGKGTHKSTKTLDITDEDSTTDIFDPAICAICRREVHLPVLDCRMAALWLDRGIPQCSEVLVIDSSLVVAALERRLDDYAIQLQDYQQQADAQAVEAALPNPRVDKYVIEAEMRRCQWNGTAWMETYVHRHLRQQPIFPFLTETSTPTENHRNQRPILPLPPAENRRDRCLDRLMRNARSALVLVRGDPWRIEAASIDSALSQSDADRDDAYESKPPAQSPPTKKPPIEKPRPHRRPTRKRPFQKKPPPQNPPAQDKKDIIGWVCSICRDDDIAVENRWGIPSCGHEFCRECWPLAVGAMLRDARASGSLASRSSQCPHPDCTENITGRHIQEVAPELMPVYEKRVLDSFVAAHSTTMRWCPGPECGRVAVRSRPQLFDTNIGLLTHCDHCRTSFCFDCGNPPHVGRPCLGSEATINGMSRPPAAATAAATVDMVMQQRFVHEIESNRMNVRNCPHCGIHIEKTGGCNHMTCKCGHHFCWLCQSDWTSVHFCGRENMIRERARVLTQRIDLDYVRAAHFERRAADTETVGTAVDPVQQRRIDIERRQNETPTTTTPEILHFLECYQGLERFAHYYNRFLTHGQGQNFAENQSPCLDRCAADYTKMSDMQSGAVTDFFFSANRLLVASRRMLKYTYCYIYLKVPAKTYSIQTAVLTTRKSRDDSSENESIMHSMPSSTLPTQLVLFLDHQERLERSIERLSFLMENAVTPTDRCSVINMVRSTNGQCQVP